MKFLLLFTIFSIQIFGNENDFRIVSLNGTTTEIICALGLKDKLVGVDTSSIFPEEVQNLPKVGYQRNLSLEGILSLKPNLVIGTTDAGPSPIWESINQVKIKNIKLNAEANEETTFSRIEIIAKELGKLAEAKSIIDKNKKELKEISFKNQQIKNRFKVLFIYSRGSLVQVAGKNTSIAEMFRLSGIENSVKSFEGFKPITSEALVEANPDFILLPTFSFKQAGGIDEIKKLPGVNLTKAGKENKIVHLDDLLLLGFSTRLGEGVTALHKLIYNQSK
jgi:iron complex transport system substrate-binding protein